MKGNFQVRFLEGGGLATARLYSAEIKMKGLSKLIDKEIRQSLLKVLRSSPAQVSPRNWGCGQSLKIPRSPEARKASEGYGRQFFERGGWDGGLCASYQKFAGANCSPFTRSIRRSTYHSKYSCDDGLIRVLR
jgi:hypothetical protein